MVLKWHGHSCFSVETGGGTAVYDPYEDGSVPGCGPVRLTADAVFCSHDHHDHNARDLISLTGREFTARVEAFPCYHDEVRGLKRGKNTAHVLTADGLRVAHLGDLGHMPKGKLLDALLGADALLIPVGGYYTIDPATAKRVIDAVRPRVVIPMHYRLGGMGFPVIAELGDFTALCENVIEYDTNTLDLTADTPAQTAVLRYRHE